MKLLKGKKKGFTLVELLVVMAIIGVLTGIGLPKFMKMTEASKVTTFKANHRLMVSAISMYVADKEGSIPAATANITPYLAGGQSLDGRPKGSTYVVAAGVLTSKLPNLTSSTPSTVDAPVTGGIMTLIATP